MKINRTLNKIGSALRLFSALVFCVVLSSTFAQDQVGSSAATRVEDGFPFVFSRDGETVEAMWSRLENVAEPRYDDAVYFQLRKQSKAYKDKKLHIRGRLLRAVRSPSGYYDVWVLLPDAKRDPIRVIAKNAPDGFEVDDKLENDKPYDKSLKYREETFDADAIYYRATSYDAGDELYTTPTLVALDFTATGVRRGAAEDERTQDAKRAMTVYKVVIVVVLLALWFFIRRTVKTLRQYSKRDVKRATLPDKLGKLALLVSALALSVPAQADDSDAFLASAFNATEAEWGAESSTLRPSLVATGVEDASAQSRRREIALNALYRLNGLLTASVLKERLADGPKETLGDYVASSERREYFFNASPSSAGYFLGKLVADEPIALNVSEQERYGVEQLYRATLVSPSGKRFVVYHVRALEVAEFYAGYALRFGYEREAEEDLVALLSPRIGRYDSADALSANGLDLSTYDDAPVYPRDALEKAKTLDEKRAVAKSLRWSAADSAPFYQTLAAVKRMTRGVDKRAPETDVVPLFNSPETARGRRFKIVGWARRVNAILVEDPDVVAATGIERYYQLYVYTNDSQGWPLALCVPELPPDLPTGGGSDYRRSLEFTGYFYKTWAYKNSDRPNAAEEELPQANWTKAPVLIGRVDRVEPEESSSPQAPLSPRTTALVFCALVLAWIALRRLSQRGAR